MSLRPLPLPVFLLLDFLAHVLDARPAHETREETYWASAKDQNTGRAGRNRVGGREASIREEAGSKRQFGQTRQGREREMRLASAVEKDGQWLGERTVCVRYRVWKSVYVIVDIVTHDKLRKNRRILVNDILSTMKEARARTDAIATLGDSLVPSASRPNAETSSRYLQSAYPGRGCSGQRGSMSTSGTLRQPQWRPVGQRAKRVGLVRFA